MDKLKLHKRKCVPKCNKKGKHVYHNALCILKCNTTEKPFANLQPVYYYAQIGTDRQHVSGDDRREPSSPCERYSPHSMVQPCICGTRIRWRLVLHLQKRQYHKDLPNLIAWQWLGVIFLMDWSGSWSMRIIPPKSRLWCHSVSKKTSSCPGINWTIQEASGSYK